MTLSDLLAKRLVKGLWWRRFPPIFRIGWLSIKRGNATGDPRFTVLGVGLMGLGLFIGKRRAAWQHLYTGLLEPGERMRVEVFQGRRSVGSADVGN